MDVDRLKEIRSWVKQYRDEFDKGPYHWNKEKMEQIEIHLIPAALDLLDHVDALKGDMVAIRKLIAGLAGKELTQTRVAVTHFKVYNLAAQHADEAES